MPPRKKKNAASDDAPAATTKKPERKKPTAAELAKDRDIERVHVTKEVPRASSIEDAQRQARDLAETTTKIQAINDEIAEFTSKRRKTLRELRKEQQRLAQAVTNNTTLERVHCVEVRIYRTNTVRYETSKDDPRGPGILISERAMVPGEFDQRTVDDVVNNADRIEAEEEEEGDEEDVEPAPMH